MPEPPPKPDLCTVADPYFQPPTWRLTRASDPTCLKITHLPPQPCPSSSPSVRHPSQDQDSCTLPLTHSYTITHNHTHTHEQIQKLLQKAQAPSWAWREGPPMVLTLSPRMNRSGSYRPKELMLLVPRFSSAGSFMSVLMKDLCKSSLPFMGNSRRRQLPTRFSRFKPCITSQGPAR